MQEKKLAPSWPSKAVAFLNSLNDDETGGARSVPQGKTTLYGTCYTALGKYYILGNDSLADATREFLIKFQEFESGLMMGPELQNSYPELVALHDREHQLLHLTCTALATCQHFNLKIKYEIRAAHRFCELGFLIDWLNRRKLSSAWLEGNNILFVGQLLVYLRDVEKHPDAQNALDLWFKWLDDNVDHNTGLWGSNGYCSTAEAVYGGYHQLLVYYHENHLITGPHALVDTVLNLQHSDGGFAPGGNGGACEDVDSVDILVNLYKRFDYRRAEIRYAIGKCVNHILETQNSDGGFPYAKDSNQSMMQIPDTQAPPNTSTAFATWFRIHTLALAAEVIPDHPSLLGIKFHFNKTLSMGWHAGPSRWKLEIGRKQILLERFLPLQDAYIRVHKAGRRLGGKILRNVGLR